MYKIILVLATAWLLACGNNNNTSRNNAEALKPTTAFPKDSLAREETFSFIDDCMEKSKLTLGDQQAFAFCKCIYGQLKAENPNADSIQIEQLSRDTARVVRMAANCR